MSTIYLYLTDHTVFSLLVVVGILLMVVYTWQFRNSPGAKSQVYLQLSKGGWLFLTVLIKQYGDLSGKLFLYHLMSIIAIFQPIFWFDLILELSQQKTKWLLRSREFVFWLSVASALAIVSNDWLHFYWQSIVVENGHITSSSTWFNHISGVFTYLLCLLTMFLSFRWIFIAKGIRRKPALWFTFAGVFSMASVIANGMPGFSHLPMLAWGYLLAGLVTTWAFYRWQVYDLLPLAQKTAVGKMFEGLLVIDKYNYIVDMNGAARQILCGFAAADRGQNFKELAKDCPLFAAFQSGGWAAFDETGQEYSLGERVYRVAVTQLDKQGNSLGEIILVKDVTEQKAEQQRKLEQEKIISILTERNRLSREIHDLQGQFPAYVKVQAQTIRKLFEKGEEAAAMEKLNVLVVAADTAFMDVRQSINALKNDLVDWEFFKNFQDWVRRFEKISGIAVTCEEDGSSLPGWILPTAEVHLFRIMQEVFSNVRRHSNASRIAVAFSVEGNDLAVEISDNGCGFDSKAESVDGDHFGLKFIHERIDEIDGTYTVVSEKGQGTKVVLRVPLAEPAGVNPALEI